MSNIKPLAAQIAQEQAARRQGGQEAASEPLRTEPGERYGIGVGEKWMPPPVTSIEDTGLSALSIAELILKVLYFSGNLTGYRVAEVIRLPFNGVVDQLMDYLKHERTVEVTGSSSGFGEGAYQYVITSLGISRAREALERSQYAGAAPVPINRYTRAIVEQHRKIVVTKELMEQALSHLVVSQRILDMVGPAVNSGRSIFLYGPPGNGKTTISEAIGRVVLGQGIYIPYAIDIDGQIVNVFDSVNHEVIDANPPAASGTGRIRSDPRWVRIRRPVIMVGGELTLESLDLVYDPTNKFYEAPFQVKANGGMFLIDDFGRQQVRPRDLLNRWIVPLEKRADFLTLHTGRKLEVPFDVLIVFSTNLEPRDLVDEAFLRRIRHKIDIVDPTYEEFREIFIRVAKLRGLPYDDKMLAYLIQEWYIKLDRSLRAVHPRDLVDQMKDISGYLEVPFEMNRDLLDRACEAYFVEL